ncbi:hypothetical protein [Sulfitobacter delicatus]|uniref:Uncharacterized protein n=1 Tax=Sulfitobacter delicatus TaxID=218672 RepID=A0A1G7XHQ1_9RHOB|nr:hypothetical protein [Sulfitobacter delicatus]SDG83646.1 hypothetical protein SAMN04489759_112116 [Sulfitobacter delicatus]
MPSHLPLRDRIGLWIEGQIDDKLPVPSTPEFRRTLRLWYGIQRSTQLPFSSGHMELAAAECVTDENLPAVLRTVLHKPLEKWLEGTYSDLVAHLGGISLPEGQGSPPLLVGVLSNVLEVHIAEFTVVTAGKGWVSVADDPLVADVRDENMKLQGPLEDLLAATAMLSIVPTVPA